VEILKILVPALGLAMFLEGLPYFISPAALRSYMRQIETLGDAALRGIGFALMAGGLLVMYLSTR
jgi:uncharacterized protein YjeT (DUF2065 family)